VTETIVPAGGLRERKKARTRASIREHALRLFREQGYHATTVEQIAAAAEVSPSTFFRYFPTKEDVVLQDDMDIRLVESLARQPSDRTPIAAVRAALREAWGSFTPAEWEEIREGERLSAAVPEIQARSMNELARIMNVLSEALARRAGRDPGDLGARVLAGAVVGVMMAVLVPTTLEADTDIKAAVHDQKEFMTDTLVRVDEGLALLEAGLPL
jgi:AcrR family transcriptional regulator